MGGLAGRQIDRQRYRQMDGQRYRQMDGQVGEQQGKQTGQQTATYLQPAQMINDIVEH